MATLGTMFAGGAFALGGKEKSKQQGPPINATNKDEEKFIQYVEIFRRSIFIDDVAIKATVIY